MDGEARAAATLEAPERGTAPLDDERMEQLLSEADLLERYQRLVWKIAARWSRVRPAHREDIEQEISLTLWQVLKQRPDAPIAYLMAVADKAASKYFSRGVSVDRPLSLKRRRRYEMVPLDLLADEEDGEFAPEDKVRRCHAADEWASVVEDMVVARLLFLDIYGRLSNLQRQVLRARIRGYRGNHETAVHLGLRYDQVRNARAQMAMKIRSLWGRDFP